VELEFGGDGLPVANARGRMITYYDNASQRFGG